MKKILSILVLCFCCLFGLVGCGITGGETGSGGNNTNKNKTDYVLDEAFVFDDLELTLGSNYSFVKMTNSFSDYYDKDIFRMPITVKNLDKDTNSLNYFYYDVYGPEGTKIKLFTFDFDDNVGNGGDLLTGASYTKYLYFEYAGNGNYQFIFDNYSKKINVKFSVSNGPELIETKTEYDLNEKFLYDGLEVTATGYSFAIVESKYSDYYGKPAVRLEFTVKNTMDSANNLDYLDMRAYDPSGVEAKCLDSSFDDSTYDAPKLAKNATGKVALYFAYTTPGEYKVTFGLFTTYATVKFNVDGSNVPVFKTVFGLNEQFKYDGLEITATGYTFTTVDNMFSEYNGKPVVRLQFSLKNTEDSANKLSYLDLKAFDPSGVETKGLDTYFDDSTWNSPNLQKNASGTAAYYFAYTTNGEYSITFGMLDTYVTLKFTVNK